MKNKKNQVDPEFPTGALPLYFAKISRNAHELEDILVHVGKGLGGGGYFSIQIHQ